MVSILLYRHATYSQKEKFPKSHDPNGLIERTLAEMLPYSCIYISIYYIYIAYCILHIAIFSTVLSCLVLLHSIAGSNIFLSPERDKEMKINDKISSQSIKQNEQRTHGANQINLFLKSNPFSALAPHALSCTPPLSPSSRLYPLSFSFLWATCMKPHLY